MSGGASTSKERWMTIVADAGPDPKEYETILKTIRDGVYTLDANGRITWVNETVLEEFDIGYDRDDLIGAPVSIVLNATDIQRCTEVIFECLQDGRESGRCEIAVQAADGREIPCELHLALLPLDDGEFQGTVGVLREIGERKRREQMFQVMNRVLRHNLRNDMNVILGRAELLQNRLEDESAENAAIIRRVGEELIDLTEKIRWLADLDGLSPSSSVSVDVTTHLADLVASIEAAHPSATITLASDCRQSYDLSIGRDTVFDAVLREVLENSVVHHDRPDARIEVAVEEEPGWLRIVVTDDGPGLPAMEREVLERGSETPLKHGSGIGLWIVHWSLTTVGGDVTFASDPGAGAQITLRFPRD